MKVILTLLFFYMSFNFALAQSQTRSEEYAWLQTPSDRTDEFVKKSKVAIDQAIASNPHFPPILNLLLRQFPANVDLVEELSVNDSKMIIWSRKELEDVFHVSEAGVKSLIFSTASLKPKLARPLSLTLSPSKRFVVIQLQLDGNIDVSLYVIYDLHTRSIKRKFQGLSYLATPAWVSDEIMMTMHPDSSPRLTSVLSVNLTDLTFNIDRNRSLYKFNDWVAVTSLASKTGSLKNIKTGKSFEIKTHITSFNDVEETESSFFYVLHEHNDGSIMRLEKKDGALPERFIPAKPDHWLSSIQLVNRDILLANYSRDSRVSLVVYDLNDAKLISDLRLPDNYDLAEASLIRRGQLKLSLKNFLGQRFEVFWSFQSPEETDFSSLPSSFRVGNLEFISKLEEFVSFDGVKVPARIVYLKSTVLSGSNPAYVETYGAFNYISFYLTPQLDSMKLQFLKRGGILVGTGVRGGAERGYDWYLSGTGIHKSTPARDLISIARGLVHLGYTVPEKIVSTGVSAGGDNVALAAQLSPQSFGLIIPISGIHDHLGYLHLDRWGPQWLNDYLNPYDSSDFSSIFARSPIEVRTLSQNYPQYLIVCGEEDSRVNKVHSYKLKASLDEFNKGNVFLYCVDHSGHWPNSTYTQGVEAVRTNAIIWAWIYNYLGLATDSV